MQHKVLPIGNTVDASEFSVSDITAVFCLRLHDDNRWAADRLRLVAEHYLPRPQVLICDFGSGPEHAAEIQSICAANDFAYFYVDDTDVFSLAAARNRAFERVGTELVFFSDIDTFGQPRMFVDLARLASNLGMRKTVDISLVLPVFHLSRDETQAIMSEASRAARAALLDRHALEQIYKEASQADDSFVVAYSNIFLTRRELFSLVGGYDERFRGHGSEDFEFLTRLALMSKHLAMPRDWRTDRFGVFKQEYYGQKEYTGFRRLAEAMAYPAEMFGLRIYHLWHERTTTGWSAVNDWKREKLNEAFNVYVNDDSKLLEIDHVTRPKTAICICVHKDQWGYFLPLRLAGYKILPIFDDSPNTVADVTRMLTERSIDALAIFNPYMKSHATYKPSFLLAKELGITTIVVERGALPSTIYYASDVSYNAPEYRQEAYDEEQFTTSEIEEAASYVKRLRRGSALLESQDSYEDTASKYASLRLLSQRKCFVPLQLDDDMAVTHFIQGAQTYDDFQACISKVALANPDTLFIIKPHPLSKLADMSEKSNVIVAKREDNFHALIDCASVVICYNSGVGLLALLHGKPVITIGNAFYNYAGAGHRAENFEHAVGLARTDPEPADEQTINRLAAWFAYRKYSTFVAADDMREFERRKAHGYKDILITHFRWSGNDVSLGRCKEEMPLSNRSYLWARLPMGDTALPSPASRSAPTEPASVAKGKVTQTGPSNWGPLRSLTHRCARMALSPSLHARDRERLEKNPVDFFQKAKWWPNRFFGRLLLDRSQRPY